MSEKQVIATTYQEKRPVTYSSSNSSVLQVSADGTIRPVQDAGLEWIKKACVSPYTGTIQAVITGTDATGSDSTVVTLKITVSDQTTYSSSSSGGGGGGGGGGSHSSKTVATSGTTPAASSLPEYVVRGTWTETEQHNGRSTMILVLMHLNGQQFIIRMRINQRSAGVCLVLV